MHRHRDAAVKAVAEATGRGLLDAQLLRKYIAYARRTCHPRLNADAAELLKNHYVQFRSRVSKASGSEAQRAIPITVRQLEAIVRLSEARARLELTDEVTSDHVAEAIRLFQVSTFRAATAGMPDGSGAMVGGARFDEMIQRAERELHMRLGIGQTASTALLLQFLSERQFERAVAMRALEFLVQKNQFRFKKQRKLVERVM